MIFCRYLGLFGEIISELEKTELIFRGWSRGLENPDKSSGRNTGKIGEREPSNVNDITAWDSVYDTCLVL